MQLIRSTKMDQTHLKNYLKYGLVIPLNRIMVNRSNPFMKQISVWIWSGRQQRRKGGSENDKWREEEVEGGKRGRQRKNNATNERERRQAIRAGQGQEGEERGEVWLVTGAAREGGRWGRRW